MHDPAPTPRSGRATLIGILIVVLALAVALLAWWRVRGDAGTGGEPAAATQEELLAREMAAAYFARDMRAEAREALRPLVERRRPAVQDLVHAAVVELGVADLEKARALLRRAEALAPRDPAVHFNLGHVERMEGDFQRARKHFELTLAEAPEDLPTLLALGSILEEEDPVRAEELYRRILAAGIDHGGSWYVAALYRLGRLLKEEGLDYLDEYSRLKLAMPPPGEVEVQVGNFGRIPSPPPAGSGPRGPGPLPTFAGPVAIAADFAASGVLQADVDNDGLQDVLAWGPGGLLLARQGPGFTWSTQALESAPVDLAIAFDLGNDDDLDILYAIGGELRLLQAEAVKEGSGEVLRWLPWEKSLPALPSAPAAIVAVDYDHEGDLDLLIVGAFGLRLLRNDGAAVPGPEGGFTDVTAEAGLPTERAFAWALIEDFDADQDVDFLLGGAGPLFLASNLRGGRFADRSELLQQVGPQPSEPLVADLDADGRPDLWAGGVLWLNQPSGTFRRAEAAAVEVPVGARLWSLDLDLDGSLDVFWLEPEGLRGVLSVGLPLQAPFQLALPGAEGARDLAAADLDGLADGALAHDLVIAGEGVAVLRGSALANDAARLGFRGQKDNRRGVGALIDVRAGPIYRRIFWRGEPELAGVGAQAAIDYVRITWPNGVVQWDLRRELGDRTVTRDALGLLQTEGLIGSCPFLYTWNGERFEFISDVLGITPLGLPMAPGLLVPPDHDEFVLIRGEQLAAREGAFELQITEELREVTYLDRVRLDVVDHPEGTRIYPNERFTFPPFPEHVIHVVGEALPPVRATGSDGGDWTDALAAIDDEHAAPFRPAPGQFLGLATPHWLELEYDRERVAAAPRLRLVLTGWFYWTDSSVNMAAGRDPSQEFVPPMLQVPDGQGGWRDTGPPIGFPAGKTKTMVVDVTDLMLRDDPRLRLSSTLRLYWDAIELAVDDGEAPVEVHALEPSSARLWRRGFSAPQESERPHQPERFVWEKLEAFPRWNPHPGLYTRLGDVLPLLQEIEDRYVIFGAGEAVTVRFDAAELPAQRKGWRRDYLLFLDGWAKDRDHNTLEAGQVEPLPFHGMSGYPYGPGERFPDGPEHRRWRAEWNTRPGEPWFELRAPLRVPSARAEAPASAEPSSEH